MSFLFVLYIRNCVAEKKIISPPPRTTSASVVRRPPKKVAFLGKTFPVFFNSQPLVFFTSTPRFILSFLWFLPGIFSFIVVFLSFVTFDIFLSFKSLNSFVSCIVYFLEQDRSFSFCFLTCLIFLISMRMLFDLFLS